MWYCIANNKIQRNFIHYLSNTGCPAFSGRCSLINWFHLTFYTPQWWIQFHYIVLVQWLTHSWKNFVFMLKSTFKEVKKWRQIKHSRVCFTITFKIIFACSILHHCEISIDWTRSGSSCLQLGIAPRVSDSHHSSHTYNQFKHSFWWILCVATKFWCWLLST